MVWIEIIEILDGISGTFVDVEDDAAGEEGVDHTGQSTIPLMGHQIEVS